MAWKPVPWIAAVLGVLSAPIAMLYVRRPLFAILFASSALLLGIAGFVGITGELVYGLLAFALLVAGVIVAYRCAKLASEGARPWYARWYGLAGIALATVTAIMVVRVFLYEPFKVPSQAMSPTLAPAARVLVQKHGYGHLSTYGLDAGRLPMTAALHRGDIIVFDYPRDPSTTYIKRLIGLPGDRVTYTEGKSVLVNGQETRQHRLGDHLDMESLKHRQRYLNQLDGTKFDTLVDEGAPAMGPGAFEFPMKEACTRGEGKVECVIPAGHYFMMGDNRDNSADSRYWGFVRSDQVVGKVVKVFQQ